MTSLFLQHAEEVKKRKEENKDNPSPCENGENGKENGETNGKNGDEDKVCGVSEEKKKFDCSRCYETHEAKMGLLLFRLC